MRITQKKQISIPYFAIEYGFEDEWSRTVRYLLDNHPEILVLIQEDLNLGQRKQAGRKGMTARAVFVAIMVMKEKNLTYRALVSEMQNNIQTILLSEMSPEESKTISKSTLQWNISKIKASVWDKVTEITAKISIEEGLSDAAEIRIDSTAIRIDAEYPLDSKLLYIGIKRIYERIKYLLTLWNYNRKIPNRTKIAKTIYHNSISKRGLLRKSLFTLMTMCRNAVKKAQWALGEYKNHKIDDAKGEIVRKDLVNHIKQVNDLVRSIENRLTTKKSIPDDPRIYSFSQSDARFIVKGGREKVIGHKLFISTNRAGMIMTAIVTQKNSNDCAMFPKIYENQKNVYGVPHALAADRGFISTDNIKLLVNSGVKNIGLALKNKFKLKDLGITKDNYKYLADFRAGIEANISRLKNRYGLKRCKWKGFRNVKSYVHASIAASNISTLSKLLHKSETFDGFNRRNC